MAIRNGRYYIVEEYIGGQSLEDILLIQKSVSEEFLYNTAMALCDVMLYLHTRKKPILYQDLKPEHIIFDENRLRLIDFGIAGYIDTEEIKSHCGTKGYAAPEQYSENAIDEGADIYAYGKVLKEIAGHIPKPLSAWITTLISKATMADRRDRFSSFGEINEFLASASGQKNKDAGTYLPGSIAVAGSGRGVGTTHIAVALTSALRFLGVGCVYKDCTDKGTVISMERNHCLYTSGSYGSKKLFLGELELGPGIDAPKKKYIQIRDYGTAVEKVAGDLLLYVVGGRSWQLDKGKSAGKAALAAGDFRIICNQGSKKTMKQYSKTLGRDIYCFPTDKDPMLPGRKKLRLLKMMLGIKKRKLFETKKQ